MNDMRPMDTRDAAAEASPMMRQYLEIKAANPDSLLFYRMGDFYELFFADAEAASRALGIALTKRGKHLGEDIPMCGVPVHAADEYLQRLIRLGHRVAVCEQLEDPAEAKKRGYKAVVRRDVVRLVTPGTLTEDTLLDSKRHNYLCALARVRGEGELALAWADISSGEFAVTLSDAKRLGADLARLEPGEIVCPDSLLADEEIDGLLKASGIATTPLPGSRFDSMGGERRLKGYFALGALDAHGNFSRAEIAALGGLLDYILLTQVGRAPALRPPRREEAGASMLIDVATRANLELTKTLSGERKGSLLRIVDRTVTAAGARLLAERLSNPLTDPAAINDRLDDAGYFHDQRALREDLRAALGQAPDIERALARLTVGRGSPRDLGQIREGLAAAARIAARLQAGDGLAIQPQGIADAASRLADAPPGLAESLSAALGDELPALARDGGFVRPGFRQALDENRALRDETRQVIAGLQTRYSGETGIKSLKIRYNNILGYYIEVTAQNAAALQTPELAGTFIHRQTMAGAMRFTTTELAGLEQRIATAADRALQIELEIFDGLVKEVGAHALALADAAGALAVLDVSTALAELAEKNRYARPVVDGSKAFEIVEGRHPVVEAALREAGEGSFVANPCDLSAGGRRVWLLTGPNMAGKSTFLRQNALIAVLAQMGSYVPAASAHIGVVDRLFSRVGAADDLARGRSTFMVEMVETAAILNQATDRSFVILDEIGRGTATFDGLSIAWATVESLHDTNGCRALFATHYHELTALASRLKGLANATVKVREWQGDVVFLHEVVPGVADRSYGIQVAKLAGLPQAVVARAGEVLALLEQSGEAQSRKALIDDLPLFAAARPQSSAAAKGPSPLAARMAAVLPDELSPRDALELIYELKKLSKDAP
jgi:DNA mismatch repair protein MutS